MPHEGGVFRRCGCADPVTGRQLSGRCPRLADDQHGSWYIQLELSADLDGGRRRIRRGGYPSDKAAEAVLESLRVPAPGDPYAGVLTVGDWLAHWLVSRTSPATSTMRSYSAHVRLYLAPYLGPVLLGELSAAHAQAMFTAIIRHRRRKEANRRPRAPGPASARPEVTLHMHRTRKERLGDARVSDAGQLITGPTLAPARPHTRSKTKT